MYGINLRITWFIKCLWIIAIIIFGVVIILSSFFFFQAEDGIRDGRVTGVQTCALPISQGLFVLVTRGPGLRVRDLEVQGGQATASLSRARADQDRSHREGRHRLQGTLGQRSEERRVGKEWRSGGTPDSE